MNKRSDKVTVVGAGAVGGTLAQRILEADLSDVVLIDIVKNMARAKALDLMDAAPLAGHERSVTGTDDYKMMEGSSVVIVTAGLARRPGMTREDLVKKNAAIIKDIAVNIKKYAPESIVIMVTNPLDAMTYLCYRTTGFDRRRVFGMAGVLDNSRFVNLIAEELKIPRSSVESYILGSHGDTMVPVLSRSKVGGAPITGAIAKDRLEAIIKRTRERGAEIVALLGSGSAYYSPSAAAFRMAEAVIKDTGSVMVASACLEGEYGLSGIAIGVPCEISRSGIGRIVELDLSKEERASFNESASAIKKTIETL